MTGIDPAMFELFREEVRSHAATLARGLLDVESDPANPTRIEPLMRAAHSIKGACRIVGIDSGVRLAHVMEDALVAAQHGKIRLTPGDIDALLAGSDILASLGELTPASAAEWGSINATTVARLEPVFVAMAGGSPAAPSVAPPPNTEKPSSPTPPITGIELPPVPPLEPIAIPPKPLSLLPEHSMLDLFREELREHLLVVEGADAEPTLESLKQIRGAARIVKCEPVERLAVALSAYYSAVREGRVAPTPAANDWLRLAVSTLAGAISTDDESFTKWLADNSVRLEEIAGVFDHTTTAPSRISAKQEPRPAPAPANKEAAPSTDAAPAPSSTPAAEAVVRVTAQSLNRLMGLAVESLVQARWLPSFSTALLVLKKHHDRLAVLLDVAFHSAAAGAPADQLAVSIADARRQVAVCRSDLADKSTDFDDHAARGEDLNSRLYREVIVSRMRPFGDGVHGLPRLVRDMSRSLGKEAKLVIDGEQTEVDRDILEKLES